MSLSARHIYKRYLPMTIFIVLVILSTIPVAGDTQGPGIRVQLIRDAHLSLHVTLWSGAKTAIKVSRNRLPWAADESLIVVTAIGNGQCLKRNVPVDDPMFDEISVEPNAPLSGDVDLERFFPDIRRVLEESDVQLFWAYEAPEALHISHWSGGWILIPKQK